MYQKMTTEQLINYCLSFNWQRKPKELHIHHTWSPAHKDFTGNNHLKMQNSMANYHKGKGWTDIGQHLTLAPDGIWITGRNFNENPASISGRNSKGFAIEMWGNFDSGKDKLQGEQLQSIIEFAAWFIDYFNLSADENIKFHREYASKTCPGTGIDKKWFINLVKELSGVEKITVVNGNITMQGFIKDGTSYAPVRQLAESLGAKIEYNANAKKVVIKK